MLRGTIAQVSGGEFQPKCMMTNIGKRGRNWLLGGLLWACLCGGAVVQAQAEAGTDNETVQTETAPVETAAEAERVEKEEATDPPAGVMNAATRVEFAEGEYAVGDQAQLQMEVQTGGGAEALTGVAVQLSLPESLQYVGDTGAALVGEGYYNATTNTWTVPTLGPDEQAELTVDLSVVGGEETAVGYTWTVADPEQVNWAVADDLQGEVEFTPQVTTVRTVMGFTQSEMMPGETVKLQIEAGSAETLVGEYFYQIGAEEASVLVYTNHTGDGSYDPLTGKWTVDYEALDEGTAVLEIEMMLPQDTSSAGTDRWTVSWADETTVKGAALVGEGALVGYGPRMLGLDGMSVGLETQPETAQPGEYVQYLLTLDNQQRTAVEGVRVVNLVNSPELLYVYDSVAVAGVAQTDRVDRDQVALDHKQGVALEIDTIAEGERVVVEFFTQVRPDTDAEVVLNQFAVTDGEGQQVLVEHALPLVQQAAMACEMMALEPELGLDVGLIDTPKSSPWRAGVEALYARGVMTGQGEVGRMAIDQKVNRAEMAKMLLLAVGEPLKVGCLTGEFDDVAAGAWYEPYVLNLVDRGVVRGYDNGDFGPADDVRLGEAAKMVALSFGLEVDTKKGVLGHWAGPYVTALQEAGWLGEMVLGDGNLERQLTRGEVAALLGAAVQ